MATSYIRSIRIIQESSFGSLTDNAPDTTIFNGTDDEELDCNRADLTTVGDLAQNERDDIRSGFYGVPADPETVPDSNGDLLPRRTGQLTVTLNLRGSGSQDSDDDPLVWLLAAGMTDGGKPALATETVTANAQAQTFEVADESQYVVGQILQTALVGGRAEFAGIVDATDGTPDLVEYSPAFSSELDGDDIYACRTFVSKPGAPGTVLGSSLAFRLDGDGWRTYAFGCRPSSYAFSGTGRRVQLTITLDAAYIYDDHDNASAAAIASVPYRTDGKVCHTLDCEVIVSNVIDTGDAAYPRIAGRSALKVDEWTLSITNELAPLTCPDSILGMADMEVTNRMCEASFTLSVPDSTFASDFLNRSQRQVMIGFGPGTAGEGACVFLPAGFLTVDPQKRDLGGPLVRQVLTYREGYWGGDQSSTALSNTPLRIGLTDGGG